MTTNFSWLTAEKDFVLGKLEANLAEFTTQVPQATSVDLVYHGEENNYWTASFWVGMLFLAKELAQDSRFDGVISAQMGSFEQRLADKVELETHDIGFLYTLSAVADYRVNGHEEAGALAVKAADELMTRYHETAQIIQAWGNLADPHESGRMIIDCLMNLPLLYVASELTGEPKYRQAAYAHAKQTQRYIVRENDTTYHTYFFDRLTGAGIKGETAQGYADDSCWARGQAWGIYGFALSYAYTGDASFLATACRVADYFISRLPLDHVVYWDLDFSDGDEQERDSSAAAIAVCGLLELAQHLPLSDPKRQHYEETAVIIMTALKDHYTTKTTPWSNGLLREGVYDKNSHKGVNECMLWGDYFYVEALTRLSQPWSRYW